MIMIALMIVAMIAVVMTIDGGRLYFLKGGVQIMGNEYVSSLYFLQNNTNALCLAGDCESSSEAGCNCDDCGDY